MNTFLIIETVECLLFMILILTQNKKDLSTWVLLALFTTCLLVVGYYWLSFNVIANIYNPAIMLMGGIALVQGPIIYFYSRSASNPSWRFSRRDAVHFLPFLLFALFLFIYHYGGLADMFIHRAVVYIKSDKTGFLVTPLKIFSWLILLTIPVYTILGLISWYRFKKKKEKLFSDSEIVNLVWVKYFLAGILISSVILSGIFLAGVYGLIKMTDEKAISASSSIFAVLLLYIGYIRYRQNYQTSARSKEDFEQTQLSPKEDDVQTNTSAEKYQKDTLNSEKGDAYLHTLLEFIETDKPYLKSDLTLRDVSDKLGISSNHLSQVINSRLKKNFFLLINEYRVKEYEQRVLDPKYANYKLEKIALECGFNSRTSFFTIFKKIKNMTPGQYFNQAKKQQ